MAKGKFIDWLNDDKLILLEAWARDGLVDEQIASNMGINVSTLYEWKKKYPEINEALKKGKEVVDIEVENALLKKAIGFKIALKKQKVTRDGDVVEIEEEMFFPPDTTAQIFWLKNRKPKEWRDKQEIEQSVNTDSIKDFLKAVKPSETDIKELFDNEEEISE